MFSMTHTQETKKEREGCNKKKASGAEKVKRTPHLLPESSWCVEPEWSPLLSVAQTPALDRKWQHRYTQEVHPTKVGEQTNKTRWVWNTKPAHKGLCHKKNEKKKMHANHESKKHMQQRIMVKPAKWHVCSSVMLKINLNGSSDFKWKFYFSWSEQKYWMLKHNFFLY